MGMHTYYRYDSPYCIRATCGADTLGVLCSISRISAWVSQRCLSSGKGNAKTWLRGTSNGYRLPRFLYIDVNIHLLPMRKSGSGWSEKFCVIMVERRLVFEHLMRDAFHCERADFSFVNADCYDAGIEKHPEIKAYMVCALIALARNENYSSFSSELLKLAKLIDGRNKFSNADFDSALEHVKQIIPEL